MRIGCLCVTEYRPHMLGISVAAFADQTHKDKHLVVVCNNRDAPAYRAAVNRALDGTPAGFFVSTLEGAGTVCARLDFGCSYLFNTLGCDAVVTWDDDEWRHPTFLSAVSDQLSSNKNWLITGYLWGLYVNSRTLYAEDLSKYIMDPWGYWGASLTYRREAWNRHKFTGLPFPGYDPAFCKTFDKSVWAPPIDTDPFKQLSFCHDLNCYQHCRGGGFDLGPWLRKSENISPRAVNEVFRAQQYFIDHNIEPPQVQGPY